MNLLLFYVWDGEGNGTPLQYFCLENPMDGGAWWAAIYGVAQSQTRLKWLSSSSTYGKIKVWAHWNHSFHMCLNYLGPVFCISPSWILSVCIVGGGCGDWGLVGPNVICLLIGEAIFFCPHKIYIKEILLECSSPRWWHRGLLSSLPPMNTPNLYLHMDHFLLKKSRNQLNDFYLLSK